MVATALRQEVDTLREYMKELSYQTIRMEMSVARLSDEMREFKDQAMRTDMAVARLSEEMREFKDQATQADAAVTRLSEEIRQYKDEGRRERQQINKQWGELANRLGTLVEDIVAPNLPRVAAELFSCATPDLFAVRLVRRFGGETREYDAMVVCPHVVLVNETKSRLLETHVDAICDKLAELPQVFPEYAGRHAVGILASLYPDRSVVHKATRTGILVMGMGDETMEVLNPEAVALPPVNSA